MEKAKIKINTKLYEDSTKKKKNDDIDFYTEAKKEVVGKNILLFYDETYGINNEKCITELLINDSKTEIKRLYKGNNLQSNIIFSKGKRHTSKFVTEHGEIDIEVLTKDINNKIDKKGNGTIDIDYEICFENSYTNRYMLNLEIS